MATNVTFQNTSPLNTVRVITEDYVPVMEKAKDGSEREKVDNHGHVIKHWRRGVVAYVKPGEKTSAFIGVENRRVIFEELPT